MKSLSTITRIGFADRSWRCKAFDFFVRAAVPLIRPSSDG